MNEKPISVLILAGGTLKNKFNYIKTSSECPALLPINCKSIASYILTFYSQFKNCKIYLSTNKKYEQEIKQEFLTFDFNIDFILMPETDTVIDSLNYSLQQIKNVAESIIVNLVTSIPSVFPQLNDVQFSKSHSYSNSWSGYVKDGIANQLIFKNDNDAVLPFNAFTGIFHLKFTELEKLANKNVINKSDLFSLFDNEYLKKLNVSMVDWLDCGHEINYYETKSKLISSRSFNNISFIEIGIVKKKSTHISKLRDEVAFYRLLPNHVSILFPRLISDFYTENENGVYDVEFYGYPNVAELILFWDLSYDVLRRMFFHFNEILNKFKTFKSVISKDEFVHFHKHKLYDRVKEYENSLTTEDFEILNNDIFVNGKKCKPFSKLQKYINEKIESLYNEQDFCIMHGDFCYNNILYDVPTGITKLIDPRGSFSENTKGIYGDRKYDLAKLAHSAIGGYDFFVNNKYEFIRNMSSFEYSFGNKKHEITTELMKELIKTNGYSYNDIKFIMGTLFMSMCPLHSDSTKRQIVFYVHGLKILNEVYQEEMLLNL